MNGKLVLACAISGLALSAFGATTATANTGPPPDPELSVQSESELTPGAAVTVRAVCHEPEFTSSAISSPALTAEAVSRAPGAPWYEPMNAAGKINDNAKAGTYPVSFVCGIATVTVEFTVVDNPAPPTGTTPPQVSPRPKGAADTGSLDPAPEQGPDAGVLALGGTLPKSGQPAGDPKRVPVESADRSGPTETLGTHQ